MSLRDCLQQGILNKALTATQAEKVSLVRDRLLGKGMSENEADSAALNIIKSEILDKAKTKIIDLKTKDKLSSYLSEAKTSKDRLKRFIHLMTEDPSGRTQYGDIGASIHAKAKGLYASYVLDMEPVVEFMTNKLSSVSRAERVAYDLELRKAMHGEPTSPEFSKMAESIRTADSRLLADLADTGVHVKSLTNWTPRMGWSARAIRREGIEGFVNYMYDRRPLTGMAGYAGKELTAEEHKAVLREIAHDILTNGEIDTVSTKALKASPVEQKERIINFVNAQAEHEALMKFGKGGDLFEDTIKYFNRMSRKVANYQTFGPKPEQTFAEFAKAIEVERAAEGKGTKLLSINPGVSLETLYKVSSGRMDSGSRLMTDLLGGLSGFVKSALLGKVLISSLSDAVRVSLRAQLHGLDVGKVFGKGLKNLFLPNGPIDQQAAYRAGMIITSALDRVSAAAKYDNLTTAGEFSKAGHQAMAWVLRIQGFHRWMDAWEKAYFEELTNNVAKEVSGGTVSPKFKAILTDHGITDTDVATLKSAISQDKGGPLLDFRKIEDKGLQRKLLTALIEARDEALSQPTAAVRALTTQGGSLGTLHGFFAAQAGFLKNFMISSTIMDINTVLFHPALDSSLSKAAYAAKMLVGTTLVGMVSEQITQLAMGRDMMDWSDPELMLKGYARGGGFAFFGDVVGKVLRKQQTADTTVATAFGPVAGIVFNALSAAGMISNDVRRKLEGKDAKLDDTFVKTIRQLVPGQNVWYMALALERYVFDNLRRFTDQDYEKHTRERAKRLRKQTGQEEWWQSGESAPSRLPEVAQNPD